MYPVSQLTLHVNELDIGVQSSRPRCSFGMVQASAEKKIIYAVIICCRRVTMLIFGGLGHVLALANALFPRDACCFFYIVAYSLCNVNMLQSVNGTFWCKF